MNLNTFQVKRPPKAKEIIWLARIRNDRSIRLARLQFAGCDLVVAFAHLGNEALSQALMTLEDVI